MAAIIQIQNLKKVYPVGKERIVALNNITFDIEQGEICCILGTSGSGKSTLLNQLAGLEKPTKGSVTIGKTNISVLSENKLARFRQKYIGFVFQSYNLLPAYTALENVAMPLMFRGISKSKRNKKAAQLLKLVGLEKRMYHKPTQMSGGQQQRVGIARAFVSKPKIIFADEPTGNLDSKTTREVMELMVNMCRKYNETLVLVTHDRDLALYADRIITLQDGSIIKDQRNQSIARTEEQIQAELEQASESETGKQRETAEDKNTEVQNESTNDNGGEQNENPSVD
ncbi:MAG: ABC transporter ATP-binding protein [Negativibacillus sp.]